MDEAGSHAPSGAFERARNASGVSVVITERACRAYLAKQTPVEYKIASYEVAEEVTRRLPGARVLLRPMSLTSGAHMGPGTWALAYLGLTADGLPAPADGLAPEARV